MTNEIIISDVGNKKELVLKEFQKDLAMKERFESFHNQISHGIKDIFQTYLDIGSTLIRIQEENLLSITEYSSILEYASDQFDLSNTTTSNIMNISKRFADENHRLKPEYRDFQFSKLVEMISIPEKELKLIEPHMTVKEIRLIKKATTLDERIPDMISDDSLYGMYLKTIKEYDWFSLIESPDKLTITSKVVESNDYSALHTHNITIKFTEPKLSYKIELILRKQGITLSYDWHWRTIESLDQLNDYLIEAKKEIQQKVNNKLEKTSSDDDTGKGTITLSALDDRLYLGYQYPFISKLLTPYLNSYYKQQIGNEFYFYLNQTIKRNDPYIYKLSLEDNEFIIYDFNDVIVFSSKEFEPLIKKAFQPFIKNDVIDGQMTIDDLGDSNA